jgi:hypothetical protein
MIALSAAELAQVLATFGGEELTREELERHGPAAWGEFVALILRLQGRNLRDT